MLSCLLCGQAISPPLGGFSKPRPLGVVFYSRFYQGLDRSAWFGLCRKRFGCLVERKGMRNERLSINFPTPDEFNPPPVIIGSP